MIVRHNWSQDATDIVCRDPACDASLPKTEFTVGDDITSDVFCLKADELWHQKYRPMAALCTMVEEAKGEAC